MANTIAGANLAEIAMESLPALTSSFLPARAFTTDFSSDIANRGASVTTRYPTVPTAQNLATNYTPTDVTMTAVTVTLNTYYGFAYSFDDLERSKSSINLNELFIAPAISAVSTKFFGDVWDLVNDTNYPVATATELTVTAANFDRDDVADLAAQLTTNKAPKVNRSLILNPTYYASLAKDLNAADSAGQVTTIGEHRIPKLHGFDVYESDACDANAVSVAGLAAYKTTICLAARQVDVPQNVPGLEVATVVLPDIGLPIQFRKWYDMNTGKLIYMMGVLYGVSAGVPNAGIKIVSA